MKTKLDVVLLKNAYLKGNSDRQVAKIMKCSKAHCRRLRISLGIDITKTTKVISVEGELWKPILNNLYSISNRGRVKRNSSSLLKLDGITVQIWKEKLMSQSINNKGYVQVKLVLDLKSKFYRVHRLVALNFLNNPDNLPVVNHLDGVKTNNFDSNLEWTTLEGNSEHARNMGLDKGIIGTLNPNSKLTEKDILNIRNSKLSKSELSNFYQIHVTSINNILVKRTWKHI